MHELHLINDLMEDLLKAAKKGNIKKITRVYVAIGGFNEITPETLRFHFAEKAKGTIAEGAAVDLQVTNVREVKLMSFDGE